MRFPLFLAAMVLLALSAGCTDSYPRDAQRPSDAQLNALDAWNVRSNSDTAINNAIITQHTLYPYHFAAAGPALNDLGQRDLGVLLAYYKSLGAAAPVAFPISVRRGGVPDALYDARVTAVKEAIHAAGLDDSRLQLTDSLPGGAGISSEQVVQILLKQQDAKNYSEGTAGVSGSSSSGGSTSNTPH